MALVPAHSKVTIAKGEEAQVIAAGARAQVTLEPRPKPGLGNIVWTFDGSTASQTNGVETEADGEGVEHAPAVPGSGNSSDFYEGEVRALYLGDTKPGGDDAVVINVINWTIVP